MVHAFNYHTMLLFPFMPVPPGKTKARSRPPIYKTSISVWVFWQFSAQIMTMFASNTTYVNILFHVMLILIKQAFPILNACPKYDKPLLILHRHKTGGTALVLMLDHFCRSNRYRCAAYYDNSGKGTFRATKLENFRSDQALYYDLIVGHLVSKSLPKVLRFPETHATMFVDMHRLPVTKSLSLFFHLRSMGKFSKNTTTNNYFERKTSRRTRPCSSAPQLCDPSVLPFLYERYAESLNILATLLGKPNYVWVEKRTNTGIQKIRSVGGENSLEYMTLSKMFEASQCEMDRYLHAVHCHWVFYQRILNCTHA